LDTTAVDHWLITRFNVAMAPDRGDRLDPYWMGRRIDLFRHYCAPSVARQTCQSFRWLILVDRETPPPHREALRRCSSIRRFEIMPVGPRWPEELSARLATTRPGGVLLTSRLDTDDALRRNYVSALRDAVSEPDKLPEFLEFPHGLKLDESTGRLYRFTYRSGGFISLAEQVSDRPLTCYCCPHNEASRVAPLRAVTTEDSWVQVIHSSNNGSRLEEGLREVAGSVIEGW
jgi:hypothetical protein